MFSRLTSTVVLRFMASCAALFALTACGSGSIYQPLVPSKFVAFGDGAADLGQTGARYTVNDGTVNTWTERTAVVYGATLTTSVNGGLSYATGGARIGTGANSLEAQISNHLAKGTPGTNDVFLIDGGAGELFALAAQRFSGALSSDAALNAAATASGQAMAAQIRRLVTAGGKRVVVANSYNIGLSPYATANTATAVLKDASRAFNDALKIAMVDLGANVLLVDAEAYFSLVYNNGTVYLGSSANVIAPACAASAYACTASNVTVPSGVSYNSYMFADDRYFTPTLNALWGDFVYSKIKNRW